MSAERQLVDAEDAPAAIGPYSHAVQHGSLLFCSGSLPVDPASGETYDLSVGGETEQCLRNLAAVCAAAGTDLSRAIRTTIYTTSLELFEEINEAYAAFFQSEPPARVTVGVSALPKGVRVEIDAIVAVA